MRTCLVLSTFLAACAVATHPDEGAPDAAVVRAPTAPPPASPVVVSGPPVIVGALDFGVVDANGQAVASTSIANTSGAPLELGALMTTGPYTVVGSTCAGTIERGGACIATIAFAPGAVGAADGSLAVAPGGVLVSAPLRGVGGQTLRVRTAGGGTVEAAPPEGAGGQRFTCGVACDAVITGPTELRAYAPIGGSFAGWSGACSGTGACVVGADAAPADVTATFAP